MIFGGTFSTRFQVTDVASWTPNAAINRDAQQPRQVTLLPCIDTQASRMDEWKCMGTLTVPENMATRKVVMFKEENYFVAGVVVPLCF